MLWNAKPMRPDMGWVKRLFEVSLTSPMLTIRLQVLRRMAGRTKRLVQRETRELHEITPEDSLSRTRSIPDGKCTSNVCES